MVTLKNLLSLMPPGEKVTIPNTRRELQELRDKLKLAKNEQLKESIEYIDYMFEQEKLGRVQFKDSLN